LAFVALVYGGCLAATVGTPARASAQIVTSYYGYPYGGYTWTSGGFPSWYNYYNYSYYPYSYPNWGGNTTLSGYPQWYVNYMRWNRPYNSYRYGYYNPYRGYRFRRW
jgi:hypothetical protein